MKKTPRGLTPNGFYIVAGLFVWIILTAACFVTTVIMMYLLSVVFLFKAPDLQFVLSFALWLNTAQGFIMAIGVINLIDIEKRAEIARYERETGGRGM